MDSRERDVVDFLRQNDGVNDGVDAIPDGDGADASLVDGVGLPLLDPSWSSPSHNSGDGLCNQFSFMGSVADTEGSRWAITASGDIVRRVPTAEEDELFGLQSHNQGAVAHPYDDGYGDSAPFFCPLTAYPLETVQGHSGPVAVAETPPTRRATASSSSSFSCKSPPQNAQKRQHVGSVGTEGGADRETPKKRARRQRDPDLDESANIISGAILDFQRPDGTVFNAGSKALRVGKKRVLFRAAQQFSANGVGGRRRGPYNKLLPASASKWLCNPSFAVDLFTTAASLLEQGRKKVEVSSLTQEYPDMNGASGFFAFESGFGGRSKLTLGGRRKTCSP